MMKKLSLIIALVLIICFSTSIFAVESYNQGFGDVGIDYWASSYIAEMNSRGVINGYPDGNFYPDNTVTRAEFAKIMVCAAGMSMTSPSSQRFEDVPVGEWYAPYVEAACPYLSGYEYDGKNYYNPDTPALREDIAVALVKLKGYSTKDVEVSVLKEMFSDYDSIPTEARIYIATAVERGLISGYEDKTFRGQATITRAEAATMLCRAYSNVENDSLKEKKWVAIGDSITVRNGNYVSPVAKALGLSATNLGISGVGADIMRKSISDPTDANYTEERKQAVIDADIITIWGFINELVVGKDSEGNKFPDPSFNKTKYINRVENLVKTVLQLNPTAKIIMIGTTNAWDSYRPDIFQPVDLEGNTVADYNDITREIAQRYELDFIDMYELTDFNVYNCFVNYVEMPKASADNVKYLARYTGTTDANFTNKTIYRCELIDGEYVWVEYTGDYCLVDGVHPTPYGYSIITNILTNEIRSIILE